MWCFFFVVNALKHNFPKANKLQSTKAFFFRITFNGAPTNKKNICHDITQQTCFCYFSETFELTKIT